MGVGSVTASLGFDPGGLRDFATTFWWIRPPPPRSHEAKTGVCARALRRFGRFNPVARTAVLHEERKDWTSLDGYCQFEFSKTGEVQEMERKG